MEDGRACLNTEGKDLLMVKTENNQRKKFFKKTGENMIIIPVKGLVFD